MVHRIQGDTIPMPKRAPDVECALGITDGWPQLRGVNPARLLTGLYAIAALWRPRLLVSNFRAGPSAWMAFAGLARGWDVRGVIAEGQLRGSSAAHHPHLLELMELCEYEQCSTPQQRDYRVWEMVDVVVDVGSIVTRQLPKLDQLNVRSPGAADVDGRVGAEADVPQVPLPGAGRLLPRDDGAGAEGAGEWGER